MRKIWPYLTIAFASAFVTAVMFFKLQKPKTVINAETYIAEQEQKIGKIKQKGKGNNQDIEQELQQPKLSRKEKRASRKAERLSRKSGS